MDLGSFPYVLCEKCGQHFYWGTPEAPGDLEGRLKAHVCLKDMPRDKFWAMFHWNVLNRWRLKDVGRKQGSQHGEKEPS